MNRLTAVLAATTLVSAVATLHYARAWEQQRERNAATLHAFVPQALPPTRAPPEQPGGAEALPAPSGNDLPMPDEEAAISVVGVGRDPVALALARHRLDELRDPQGRAQRAKEFVDLFLSGGWEAAAAAIGMPDHQFAWYLEARVERLLQRREKLLECQLDPACDPEVLRAAGNAAARQDEAQLLGPEWHSRFRTFQQSGQERQFAEQLNRRLPADAQLSGADITRVALALAEERERFDAEAQQHGRRALRRISDAFLQLGANADSGSADEYAQLRESAAEYGRRLDSRAAGMLTAPQLAQFRSVLDAELANFLASLRNDEMEAAVRRQAMSVPGVP